LRTPTGVRRRRPLGRAKAKAGLEHFYDSLGSTVIGRHPDAIRTGSATYRDEIILVRALEPIAEDCGEHRRDHCRVS
jgi:hypothetical protein